MEIGKTKKREKSRDPEEQHVPSGGSVSTLSFSSSHPFCPVDGTSITRVVFVIARGRDTEGRDTERRNGDGSQERVKDGKKISKTRDADSRANKYPALFCVYVRARLRVSDAASGFSNSN